MIPIPQAARSSQGESFALDHRPRSGQVSPDQLVIVDPTDAWHYMYNPAVLQCRGGMIVPRLALVSFQPGLNGNGKTRGRGEGAAQHMSTKGWRPVPHDFKVVAFGVTRVDASPSTYLQRWEGVHADGVTSVYTYSSAWQRPRALGSRILWAHDDDGYLKFLADVMELLVQEDPDDPAIVEIAAQNLLHCLRAMSGNTNAAAEADRQRIALQMPESVIRQYAREFPFLAKLREAAQ
jgi:hypothetical protein